MEEKITLCLTGEAAQELLRLSDSLGFTPEMTAEYAIRLVAACAREGLIADTPLRAWPQDVRGEAQALRGTLIERERQSARDTRLVTTLCFSLSLLVTILLI